jgi:NAD(P)-dependent dehydrogenase (short-subunit alcohol dehydrogenase family)
MSPANRPVSKVVLITGCSSGIGKATALRLVKGGWTVYASARRVESLRDLAAAGCRTIGLDVNDEASMVAAVSAIEREHGAIGVLVNNAGYSQSGALETVSVERLRRQFETNVFGLFRLTQLVLLGMRRQGWGKIVNLSSMGGRFTLPGGGAYHASKYALEALSDALRFEVKSFGIDVILIEPGLIRTDFDKAAVGSIDAGTDVGPYAAFNAAVAKSTQEAYVKGPLARLASEPGDVAAAIEKSLNVRRPKARYVVGASARVLLTQRALLSDRTWDAFLRTQLPQPGRAEAGALGDGRSAAATLPPAT